ncbi:MAG: hypothetical protein WDO73_22570 [Ignavibacteriota bacterium]
MSLAPILATDGQRSTQITEGCCLEISAAPAQPDFHDASESQSDLRPAESLEAFLGRMSLAMRDFFDNAGGSSTGHQGEPELNSGIRLVAEAEAFAAEGEITGEKIVDGLVDGMRFAEYQGSMPLAESTSAAPSPMPPHITALAPASNFDEAGMATASIGGATTKSTGNDGAVLNFQDQKSRTAGEMVANGDAIGSRDRDSGGCHETLR